MPQSLWVFGFLSVLAFSSHAQVETQWVNQPGGVSVALNADGDVYTVRWDYAPGGDIFLAKRTAAGELLWEASSNNSDSNRHEVATWVGTDSQGNTFVSGTVRSGYSNPVDVHGLLLKFSPQGELVWRRDVGGDFDGSSTRKLLLDEAGNVVVLGLGAGANGLRQATSSCSGWVPGPMVWSRRCERSPRTEVISGPIRTVPALAYR
jgi:hypothetical protein